MPTSTPPPYFPQNSLSPPDPSRYRKFKLAVAGGILLLLLVLGGVVAAVVYIVRLLF